MANAYTFSIIDTNDLITASAEAEIRKCAEYVIELVSRYLDWKGTIDFVVEVRPASELTWSNADGLLPSYTQIAWNGAGWTNLTLTECLTGVDLAPTSFDAGCTIYLAKDGSIKNYGSPVWFDPDPRFEVDPAVPAGEQDFVGIFLHEVFHSLGFDTRTVEWSSRMRQEGDRAYFTGAQATALYGTQLPFVSGSDHYGFTADPSVGISRGLMFQWGNYERNRWDIGRIDLATLADLGHSIKSYDGLSLFELIDTQLDLSGTSGDDRLYGDYHANVLTAGGGNDLVEAGAGGDNVDGGTGNDVIVGSRGADQLNGGDGDDRLFAADTLPIDVGLETLVDREGDVDTLLGGAGDDLLFAGWGDHVDGGAHGASGDRLYVSFFGAPSGVHADFGLLGSQGSIAIGATTIAGIEAVMLVEGTDHGDYIVPWSAVPQPTGVVINGRGGNDEIVASGGGDRIDGGAGIDGLGGDLSRANVAILFDLLEGHYSGPVGTAFTNFEWLGAGAIGSFITGSGNDRIVTTNVLRDDHVSTRGGDDRVTFFDGSDTFEAGDGIDTLVVDWRTATENVLNGQLPSDFDGDSDYFGEFSDGAGRYVAYFEVENFEIHAGSGNDNLVTGNGDDLVHAGAGNDMLSGAAGNDFLDGGLGNDLMAGGAGNDIYLVDSVGDAVNEGAGEGVADEVRTALGSSAATYAALYLLPVNVEILTGTSAGGQGVRDNASANVITMGVGNDLILVNAGGLDNVSGGGGDDAILFGTTLTADDSVDGGAGVKDQLGIQGHYNGGGAMPFVFGALNLVNIETLALLSGTDTRFGDTANNRYDYSLRTIDANVGAGQLLTVNMNGLVAGEDVTFDGSAEMDGAFFFYAGGGTDRLTGSAGNDGFFFGTGLFSLGDQAHGGIGFDQLGLRGSYTLILLADTMSGIETLSLLSGTSTRFGAAGPSYSYDITMHDGNVAAGASLSVSANELTGNESLVFNGANETDGRFVIRGGRGNDRLTGGAGNDTIYGNLGEDVLTGGAGNDVFLFRAAGESVTGAIDDILDFRSGDRIDLSVIDADVNTEGNQAFTYVGSNAFSNSAGELKVTVTGNQWLIEADTDGDGTADFVLNVNVADGHAMVVGDFAF